MRKQLVLAICSMVIAGCAQSGLMTRGLDDSSPALANSTADQPIVLGNEYELVIRTDGEPKVAYFGKATAEHDGSITLENAIKRVTVTSSPPVPWLGKMFVNKSVGGTKVEQPITIHRNEIVEIRGASY